MTARARLLHRMERQLLEVVPAEDPRRTRVFARLVTGLAWSGSVALGKIAASVPGRTQDASRERAVNRWLKNPRVEVDAIWRALRPALLAQWRERELTLVLDLTPQGKQWTVIAIGAVLHGRALPIAGRVVPQQTSWDDDLRTILTPIVADIAAALPAGCPVTLVADRGLIGPGLIDLCTAIGWHWVFRVNGGPEQSNRIETETGGEERLWAVVARLGSSGSSPARLFKGAGWRGGGLTVYRHRRMDETWVLFSDRPGGYGRVRDYRRRWSTEPMFQDCKERGWRVERSRLQGADRLERLLLALAVMIWWLVQLGARAIRHGERTCFERRHRRELSLIQLGKRLMQRRFDRERTPPLPFSHPTDHWRYVRYA